MGIFDYRPIRYLFGFGELLGAFNKFVIGLMYVLGMRRARVYMCTR